MKNTTFSIFILLGLFAVCAALPAHAVQGRPSPISFDDLDSEREIYVFVRSDNGHLLENHFNGTTWAWTDHGLPPDALSINNPRAITYIDESGNRRIYVFAADNEGHLVVLFHKGPGYTWQWAQQGGPVIVGASLSATTFVDDNGIRRIHVFAFRFNSGPGFRLVNHFWNGSTWNWNDMALVPGHSYDHETFTAATNYIGNDGLRRMDVFCGAHDEESAVANELIRHSWVEGAWSVADLDGDIDKYGSVVNVTSNVVRNVYTFVVDPKLHDIEEQYFEKQYGDVWSAIPIPTAAIGKPDGFITATAYSDPSGEARVDLFAARDGRLYLFSQLLHQVWTGWDYLGSSTRTQIQGVKNPVAITYLDSRTGVRRTWVFTTGGQDHLYANYWNGESWQWHDYGNP